MDITLLGTGSPIPSPDRAGPSTLVTSGDTRILIDAGRGVCMRLAGAGVMPPMLTAVLVTHLHSDHLTDLNDIVTTRWVLAPEPAPLTIYGPVGIRATVDAMMEMLSLDIGYRIAHHADLTEGPQVDVIEIGPGDRFTVGSVEVLVGATDHAPVEPSVGFRLDDGAASVALGGDGVPCATLDALCEGATAYVQSVLRHDVIAQIPMQRLQDILDYHSSVEQAAQTAERAGVRVLVLTHYVPAIAPGGAEEWRALAAEHFDGEVVLGDDLTAVTI